MMLEALWHLLQKESYDYSSDIVFLPSRRSVRSFEKLIVEKSGNAVILPKIVALGESVDEADSESGDNVISNTERVIVLSKMVAALDGRGMASALPIAHDLVRMMDYIENERAPGEETTINWSNLIDEKYAEHFIAKAKFLDFVSNVLPKIFPDKITETQKRNQGIREWISEVKKYDRVFVCGSTASVPATADLIAHIAKMPNGKIILPGKIGTCSNYEAETNPYHSEYKLLERIGVVPSSVQVIDVGDSEIDFFNDAFANTTSRSSKVINNAIRIDCVRESEEAEVVAEISSRAVSENKSVLVITPDAAGNQRLKEAFAARGICADFSGGTSGVSHPLGRFILNYLDSDLPIDLKNLYGSIKNLISDFTAQDESIEIIEKIKTVCDILVKYDIVLDRSGARGVISDALSSVQIRPPMIEDSKVFVLGTIESRMQTADVVILTGLNEEMFPDMGYENPWLPRGVADKIGLPSPMRKVSLQSLDFITLSCAKNVYWTRSNTSGGTQTIESRFLSRIAVKNKNDTNIGKEYVGKVRSYDNVPYNPINNNPPSPPMYNAPIFVTHLEDLIHNPYVYYAKSILNLKRKPDAWEDRYAIEFGNLVHKVIEEKIKNRNLDLVNVLKERAQEILPPESVLGHFWNKRFIEIAKVVEDFFVGIPMTANSEIYGETKIGNRIVCARADLVWQDDKGSHVVDIKTGKAPNEKQLSEGMMPQLPLEALMFSPAIDISFLQLKRDESRPIVYNSEKMESFINAAENKAKEIFIVYEKRMKRIIGIDPGLIHTGWAIIDTSGSERKYVSSGVILPPKNAELSVRLKFIFDEVSKICETWKPDECGIEITFVNKNPTSTLLLGHARASAIVSIATHNIQVFEYEPNKIKKAITSAGHADKDQIYKMVKILLPAAAPKTADESDAIAIALAHSNMSRIIC